MDFITRFALAGAAVMFAAWLAITGGRWLTQAMAAIRPYLAAFVIFTFVVMNYAQKPGGTNDPPQGAGSPLHLLHFYTANPPASLFRLESESTNETYSYAMPSNGERYANWWLRGAYEDVFRIDLGEMRFPCGTNLCDSLWIYSWGMAGVRLGDVPNRIVAAGVPMSAVPQVSQFWSAETEGGGRLLTWENFFLGRDTNTPVSAQIELMSSGDFITRSNLVESVYRRVNPDDWDDDGIPNEEDIDPIVCDGDYFGPHQELPEGANSNAYCWVDLVVPDANALVTFTGDGYSALPDPVFIAKAGATNRVILLIGKTYQVASRMPIACIGQSSAEIEVDQVSATELSICWSVVIEASEMRSGAVFAMTVVPDWLGGGFTWTNGCCAVVSLGGLRYGFTCVANCLCTGCGAEGYYGYEAYRLPAIGGSCGCSPHGENEGGGDDDGDSPGVSVSFSHKVLFYEDAYTNSTGVAVAKSISTNVLITCAVYGGQYGGVASFSTFGLERLSHVGGDMIPDSDVDIQREQTMTWTAIYEPEAKSSSVDDISVEVTFSEMVSGNDISDSDALTVIKIEITPEEEKTGCVHRHIVGVREVVRCKARPDVGQWTESGAGALIDNRGDVQYICPLLAGGCGIEYTFRDESYQVPLAVIEPSAVVARSPRALTYYLPAGSAAAGTV